MSAENEKPDDLTAAYRRASADEAGRPGDAARRVILAEAEAAVRRRQPVANEPRYLVRAVAGIAVLGVAVVLWRQMDHRLPGVVTSEVTSVEAPRVESQPAPPSVKMESPLPAAPASAAPARGPAQLADAAKDMTQKSQRADAVADTTGAGAASGQLERSESLVAGAQRDDSDTGVLVRYFPQQYTSDMPHSVWLVRDAAGRMLQSGELVAGQRLEDLTPQLESQLGRRRLGVWREQTLINARGQPIRLLTTTLP